jgi:hypothetical protein
MAPQPATNHPIDLATVDADEKWPLRQIEEALRGLRFGTVTIVVQDGVVIQLERTEKRRLQRGGALKK